MNLMIYELIWIYRSAKIDWTKKNNDFIWTQIYSYLLIEHNIISSDLLGSNKRFSLVKPSKEKRLSSNWDKKTAKKFKISTQKKSKSLFIANFKDETTPCLAIAALLPAVRKRNWSKIIRNSFFLENEKT